MWPASLLGAPCQQSTQLALGPPPLNSTGHLAKSLLPHVSAPLYTQFPFRELLAPILSVGQTLTHGQDPAQRSPLQVASPA